MPFALDKDNGTQTATVGTEHTLLTETDPGVYVLTVNLVEMVNGDAVTLRAYAKNLTGDIATLVYEQTYGNVQGDGAAAGSEAAGPVIVKSPPIESPFELIWTLTQDLGAAGRDFAWRQDQLA